MKSMKSLNGLFGGIFGSAKGSGSKITIQLLLLMLMLIVADRVHALTPPTVYNPANYSKVIVNDGRGPCFSWGAVAGASIYTLTVNYNGDFPSQRWAYIAYSSTARSVCWNGGAGWQSHGNVSSPPVPSQLSPGTNYYWRAGAAKADWSEWTPSVTRRFTASWGRPGLVSSFSVPITLNTTGSYTVSWGTATQSPTRYDLQERANNGSWVTVYSGGSRSYFASNRSSADYYYRVRACNSDYCGSYKTSTKVQVRRPLGAATLSSPTNGTSVAHSSRGSQCFSWSAATNATHYNLLLSETTDFHSQRWMKINLTGTSVCFGNSSEWLPYSGPSGYNGAGSLPSSRLDQGNKTYYWQVMALDGTIDNPIAGTVGTKVYVKPSAARVWKVGGIRPSAASLNSPANNHTVAFEDKDSQCFSWNAAANATHYNLLLSETTDFHSQRWMKINLTGTSACFGSSSQWLPYSGNGDYNGAGSLPRSRLDLDNKTYYWQVMALDGAIDDPITGVAGTRTLVQPSATRTWNIAKQVLQLPTPTLVTPSGRVSVAYNQRGSQCFSWNSTAGASHYNLQLSESPDFNQRWMKINITGTSACFGTSNQWLAYSGVDNYNGSDSLPTNHLDEEGKTYYWRVVAMDGTHNDPIAATSGTKTAEKASAHRTWQVQLNTAPPPALVLPEDRTSVSYPSRTSQCFSWQPVNWATHYNVQISETGDFRAQRWMKINQTGTSTCFGNSVEWKSYSGDFNYEPADALPSSNLDQEGKTYYWRVVALDGTVDDVAAGTLGTKTTARWGETRTWQVQLDNAFTSINLVSPEDNTAVAFSDRASQCFSWNPVDRATHYNLQLSESEDFMTKRWMRINIDGTVDGTSVCFDLSSDWLSYGADNVFEGVGHLPNSRLDQNDKIYYWRVVALDGTIDDPIAQTLGTKTTARWSETRTWNVGLGFTIPQLEYDVYQATDGTLYLVSKVTPEFPDIYYFKIVDIDGTKSILRSSQQEFEAELEAGTATLESNYTVDFSHYDEDGLIDLVLVPAQNSMLNVIVVGSIESNFHTVTTSLIYIDPVPPVAASAPQPITPSVGSTGGQFRVDESGAATYSVPIAVPTGTAGVAPQLSLNYSSNAGNGPLGIGWSLSGLSAINRCGKNMAQNINETTGIPEISGITNTSSDRFCMGGQQLFSDGTYGGNNTSYYTELFNNTDITSHGGSVTTGPNEWRIKTRAGDTHYYGKVGASENALVKTEDNSVNRLWLLRKTEDLAGNTIEYEYGKAADNSEVFIKNITYGGNVNVGTSYHSQVQFVYADEIDSDFVRSDSSSGYSAGSTVKQTKLLKQIRTYNGSNHIKTYQIFHDSSNTGLTRLKAIQECSFLNNCTAPIKFEWSDINSSYTQSRSYAPGATRLDPDHITAVDIDGNGMTDKIFLDDWGGRGGDGNAARDVYIEFSPSPSKNSGLKLRPSEFNTIQFIDHDLNGVMDLLYQKKDGTELTIAKWDKALEQLVTYDIGIGGGVVVDLDGDGKMDLLERDGNKSYWHRHSTYRTENTCTDDGRIGRICRAEHSFTEDRIEVTVNIPELTIENDMIPFVPNISGGANWVDLNGDGKTDLIAKVKQRHGDDPGRYTYSYNYYGLTFNVTTKQFESYGKLTGNYPGMPRLIPMDINRDGLTDVLYRATTNGNWLYKLSLGNGFSDYYDTGISASDTGSANKSMVLDYDHDGRNELFIFSETVFNNNTGKYDIYSFNNGIMENIGVVQGMIEASPRLIIGDFNHRSVGVELYSYRDGWGWYLYSSGIENFDYTDFAMPSNVIKSIVGSSGVETVIHYSALPDTNVYSTNDDNVLEYPNLKINPFIYIVDRVTSDTGSFANDGTEETLSVSYRYEDLAVHTQGRGQLGFKKLISIDDQTGIETVTEYKQTFPFIGMPKSTIRKLSDGTELSTAFNHWEEKTYFDRTFPVLASSVEKNWNLDSDGTPNDLTDNARRFVNQVITTNTYESNGDNYGNLVSTTVLNTTSDAVDGSGGSEWFNTFTTNVYGTSTYEKKYARLSSVTVEKSRSDVAGSHTQTSEFEYYSETHTHNKTNADGYAGMLNKETIFKGDPKEVNKLHQFDEFGNKTVEIVEAKKRDATTLDFDTSFTQRKTETFYTSNGRYVESVINDLDFEKSFTYGGRFGGVLTETGANGLTVSYGYDELGTRYYTLAPDGTYSTEYSYLCGIGDASCPTEGVYYTESQAYALDGTNLSGFARTYYNKMGQEIVKEGQTFGDKKLISRTEYDKYGRVSKGYSPVFGTVDTVGAGFTTASYDALGRLISQTEPGTRITTRQYQGTSTTTTNAIGQVTIETKNINGELGKVRDNNNKEMTYLYDTRGNFVKLIDSDLNEVEMQYDTVGHKIATVDPDKGTWQYKFNGFGELVQQIDARGVVITQEYDDLGRMIKRVDNADVSTTTPIASIDSQTTCWIYDTAAFGDTGASLKGQLHKVQLFAGEIDCGATTSLTPLQEKITGFDNLGRAEFATQKIKQESSNLVDTYLTMNIFEAASSRVLFTILPREVTLKNHYDGFGNLTKITDAIDDNILYREVTNIDKFGNVSHETYGNGIKSIKAYDAQTGFLESVTAGKTNGSEMIDFQQYFDGIGNVTQRKDNIVNRQELFGYVEGGSNNLLNRLTSFTVTEDNSLNKTYSYDDLGNLKSKSDIGDNYEYGAGNAGIHALTSIRSGGNLLRTFGYDANGNMTSDIDSTNSSNNRTIQYGAFEKPVSISKGSASQIAFRYGSSRERYKRIDNVREGSTPVIIETTYLGGYEKVVHTGGARDGKTEHKYMLGGVALKVDTEEGGTQTATKTRYLHKDHLGSVVAITDELGTETARFRYDPFGKQHTVVSQSATLQTPVTVWLEDTRRGFTGHEMLSSVDVIHMNGRIYDANIGRFMQADAYIQAPKNMQSMNRYTYVLNNPLSYTDPSGHFFKSLKKYWRTIAAIAINIWLPGAGGLFNGGFWATVSSGAISGAVATGSLKGALTGAFSAGVFFGIGEFFQGVSTANYNTDMNFFTSAIKDGGLGLDAHTANLFASRALTTAQQLGKVLAHGMAGGVMSTLNGGKFGHGFASAGVTQAFSKSIDSIGNGAASHSGQRILAAAVLGGVTSAATGGKFANGAVTAAFSRAFNEEIHSKKVYEEEAYWDDFKRHSEKIMNRTTVTFGRGFGYKGKLIVPAALDISLGVEATASIVMSSDTLKQGYLLTIDGNAINISWAILNAKASFGKLEWLAQPDKYRILTNHEGPAFKGSYGYKGTSVNKNIFKFGGTLKIFKFEIEYDPSK